MKSLGRFRFTDCPNAQGFRMVRLREFPATEEEDQPRDQARIKSEANVYDSPILTHAQQLKVYAAKLRELWRRKS